MPGGLAFYMLLRARAEPWLRRRSRRETAEMARHAALSGVEETGPEPGVGETVWIHLSDPEDWQAAEVLVARLASERADAHVVVTSDASPESESGWDLSWRLRPLDAPQAVDGFLARWRPAAGIWIGDHLWPALLSRARGTGIPMMLVNASEAVARTSHGVPAAELLRFFDEIFPISAPAATVIDRVRRHARACDVVGPLQRGRTAPPCEERDRRDFAAAIAARPVWFASEVGTREAGAVLDAHASAQRGAHRLLLIVRPSDAQACADIVREARERGYPVAFRSEQTHPSESTSVFVADMPDEDGLWYRVAPLTFIGGSLSDGALIDPFAPASMGSVVLHGPALGRHNANFAALARRNAARAVATAGQLGEAVSDLQAADRAASLAREAWDVVSTGAEVTDAAIRFAIDALDRVHP